jgi:hypothetical protein
LIAAGGLFFNAGQWIGVLCIHKTNCLSWGLSFMATTGGKSRRGAGRWRPAHDKPQKAESGGCGDGVGVRILYVPPKKLAAIEQELASDPAVVAMPPLPGAKSGWKTAGAGFVVVVMLAAGGDGLNQHEFHYRKDDGHSLVPVHAAAAQHSQTGQQRMGVTMPEESREEILEEMRAQRELLNKLARGQDTLLALGRNHAVEPVADRALAGKIGRMRYENNFEDIWLDGIHHDLRERNKARLCIQYLFGKSAWNKTTACHFERQIDPYVREHSKLEPLPNCAEVKIHHYFNPSTGKFARLGRDLIQSAGRGSGRYFLKV